MAEYVSLAPKSQGLAAVSLFLTAFIFLGTNTHFGRGRMMGAGVSHPASFSTAARKVCFPDQNPGSPTLVWKDWFVGLFSERIKQLPPPLPTHPRRRQRKAKCLLRVT